MKNLFFVIVIFLVVGAICCFGVNNYDKIRQQYRTMMDLPCFEVKNLCFSWTAIRYSIDNTPENDDVERNLQALIDNVLIPARQEYGKYIKVNSGYRSPDLNKKVGGVSTSQHQRGEAIDITAGSVEKNKILYDIIDGQGRYDQLIWERGGTWIHVSYKREGKNRKRKFALD